MGLDNWKSKHENSESEHFDIFDYTVFILFTAFGEIKVVFKGEFLVLCIAMFKNERLGQSGKFFLGVYFQRGSNRLFKRNE